MEKARHGTQYDVGMIGLLPRYVFFFAPRDKPKYAMKKNVVTE